MYFTRELRAVAAVAVFLAALAITFDRPLLLAGAALIGGWILASQHAFLRAFDGTVRTLSVAQTLDSSFVQPGDSTTVTIDVTLERPTMLSMAVTPGLPSAATVSEECRLRVDSGSTARDATVTVTWPVAGRFRFDAATVTATDGLFSETIELGDRPTITAEPRVRRPIHVGEGGHRIVTTNGEHASNRPGSGVEPIEIREYVPGDAAKQIDWKVTARLATPHVREFEAPGERRTLLVVDHRSSLSTGSPRETKLDYLREVALATVASSRTSNDPLNFLAVGDLGVTFHLYSTAVSTSHETIRRKLFELEPTDSPGGDTTPDGTLGSGPARSTVRRAASALEGDDDPFARTLRPFYSNRHSYRHRIRDRPLFGGVRTALASNQDATWIVIFTDDSSPSELRETVSVARRTGADVTVFLAPTVLYEPNGLLDLERAYDRYLEFEELRRTLGRTDRVNAFEVGPGDRFSTIVETSRARGGRS